MRAVLFSLCLLAGLALTGEAREAKTLRDIRSTGTLTVCADPDNLPFSSGDAATPGYDVEIARAVAAELGARAEFKWIPTRSARAALRNLLDGDCDLFPGLPASPGFAEEYPRLAFSRPYYTMGHVIVTTAGSTVGGLADLKPVVTAVEALSAGDVYLLGKGFRRKSYRTQEAAFRAVEAGEVPVALLWGPPAGWLATRGGASSLRLVPVADSDLAAAFGLGFLRADRTLKPAIDQALTELESRGLIKASLGRYGVRLAASRRPREQDVLPGPWTPPEDADIIPVADTESATPDPIEGRFLFEANCEQCHGLDGRGGGAVPRLQSYPLGAENRFVTTVLQGRNSQGMPPWGGLLTETQVRSVFAYVHALVPVIDTAPGASSEERARQVFGQVCSTCHGPKGGGTQIAPSLQAFKGADTDWVTTVLKGRPGTAMAPYNGVVTSEVAQKIRDYVREVSRAP